MLNRRVAIAMGNTRLIPMQQLHTNLWGTHELRQKHNQTTAPTSVILVHGMLRDKTKIIDCNIICQSRYHRALWDACVIDMVYIGEYVLKRL